MNQNQNNKSPLGGKYALLQELGRGGTATVYLANHLETGQLFAIKIGDRHSRNALHEGWIMQTIHHPMAPVLIDFFSEQQKDCLVMEYVNGSSLSSYLEHSNVSFATALRWTKQITIFLQYLHTLPTPIYFCDLKPSNLMLLSSGNLKLIDFGAAVFAGEGSMGYGTDGYAPRELYETGSKLGPFTDYYSLGKLMEYFMSHVEPCPFWQMQRRFQKGGFLLLAKLLQRDWYRKRKQVGKHTLEKLNRLGKP